LPSLPEEKRILITAAFDAIITILAKSYGFEAVAYKETKLQQQSLELQDVQKSRPN